jgi:hypothetical protein
MGTIPPATLAGDEILQKGTTNPISTQTTPQTTTEKNPNLISQPPTNQKAKRRSPRGLVIRLSPTPSTQLRGNGRRHAPAGEVLQHTFVMLSRLRLLPGA